MGVEGLLGHFLNLLSNQAEHLIGLVARTLHLFKLTLHDGQLAAIDVCEKKANCNGPYFEKNFPKWRGSGLV